MRIDTTTGLHGVLIEYAAFSAINANVGKAIVYRDWPVVEDRPYSVHTIADYGNGLEASNGKYDLTYDEALKVFNG